MSFLDRLAAAQQRNNSWLSISLNIDLHQLPAPLLRVDDPMFPFARSIIEATRDLVCAYQIDPAYFLSEGAAGMIALERIVRYIPDDLPLILDWRFGEIGASAAQYRRSAFEAYQADAITFSPGTDRAAIEPFLQAERAVFIVTESSANVSLIQLESIAIQAASWMDKLNGICGLVLRAKDLYRVRRTAPQVPVIIAELEREDEALINVMQYGPTSEVGPIVDSGTSIVYATSQANYTEAAREAALHWRDQLNRAQSSIAAK
jgi:orotidine-5'-phosphate decarboxylase